MKSVLISIQPKWCELIVNGKKTVEVRKTKPKLETPFKVYIYMTKEYSRGINSCFYYYKNGKVIGEFVCDKVYFRNCDLHDFDTISLEKLSELSCVSEDNLLKYADRGNLYGWLISNLVIYDKPRELSEFGLTRPFQSWGYVESEVDTE